MNNSSISRFWDKFTELTNTYKLRPGSNRWYVKHAESYIKYHKDIKLLNHQPNHIESFLTYKSRHVRIQDWQFRQVVHAIEILFVDLLKPKWASTFPWKDWSDLAINLPSGDQYNSTNNIKTKDIAIDLDTVSSFNNRLLKQVSDKYPLHITNLIKAIRIKNYSIRT